jgi:ComF family protein
MGRAAQKPYCPRCGLTLVGPADAADGCPQCLEQRSRIEAFCRVGEYDGFLQGLICKYKFARQQHLDRPLGALLATALQAQPWTCELDALIPVPISWRSRWEYHFSPPGALAREISGGVQLPVLPLLYERGKRRRQVGLTLEERRRNVRGVYRLCRGARPAGGIFCIVDDVSTTGSTVQEVARVLKQAGAIRVYAAVLARTNPDRAHSLKA